MHRGRSAWVTQEDANIANFAGEAGVADEFEDDTVDLEPVAILSLRTDSSLGMSSNPYGE